MIFCPVGEGKNLYELKDAVVSSIGDSVHVQTQLKSFRLRCLPVAANCLIVNFNVLKTVVKYVVAEEDKRRNLLKNPRSRRKSVKRLIKFMKSSVKSQGLRLT